MKTSGSIIICFLAQIMFVIGCSHNNSPVEPPLDTSNLITNDSFEIADSPSLNGWTVYYGDSSRIEFSSNVPNGGGLYSVSMQNRTYNPPDVRLALVPRLGKHVYRFSFWGMTKRSGTMAELPLGGYYIGHRKDPQFSTLITNFADTIWTQYSVTDTIDTATPDTMYVGVFAGGQFNCKGVTYLDLCKLEINN